MSGSWNMYALHMAVQPYLWPLLPAFLFPRSVEIAGICRRCNALQTMIGLLMCCSRPALHCQIVDVQLGFVCAEFN